MRVIEAREKLEKMLKETYGISDSEELEVTTRGDPKSGEAPTVAFVKILGTHDVPEDLMPHATMTLRALEDDLPSEVVEAYRTIMNHYFLGWKNAEQIRD